MKTSRAARLSEVLGASIRKCVDRMNKLLMTLVIFLHGRYTTKESEFRLTTRLGFLLVSTVSIAVAVLTWLIKI
jgi:hypothetical protein